MLVFDAMNCSRLDESYVRRLRQSEVDAIHTSIIWGERKGLRETLGCLGQLYTRLSGLQADVALALTVADIRRAKESGRLAVVLGLQNATPLEDDENLLWVLHRLGIRILQLTYNERNLVGDGCTERVDGGLSSFGMRVVRLCNRLRIAVDISHAGPRTLMDIVEASTAPVICSHANVRALCDHPRNLSDESIRALARKGGVLGVTSIGAFVKVGPADVDSVLDHVDHVVRVAGLDHVGLGLDLFEGRAQDFHEAIAGLVAHYGVSMNAFRADLATAAAGPSASVVSEPADQSWACRVPGLQRVTDFPHLIHALRRRGYTEREIDQIVGGNFLRVLETAWGA